MSIYVIIAGKGTSGFGAGLPDYWFLKYFHGRDILNSRTAGTALGAF
jgi:hypothetical protein